jgi:hypothetical protein
MERKNFLRTFATLSYEVPDFKLIASDIVDISAHKVSISYITAQFTLFNIIGDYLVIASGNHMATTEPIETLMIRVQPNLSICQYQEI